MQLSVAANYDPAIVPELAAFPVREVYGKMPTDVVAGGRPSYMATPLTERQLADYVAALRREGIAFNYLLNASCLGNREWGRRWQHRLLDFLERLGEMGIARLTVSTPYLFEAIRRRFPEFSLKVGIYAQVDTPRRARFWEDLGADAICLESFSINRDFERLAAIRAAVDCELTLIANHICLPNCPLQPYHQNGFAHASDGSRRLFIDYCILRCSRERLRDPALLIASQWIRPEDTGYYENLGYHSFKLLERGIPSGPLLARVRAYAEHRSPANLAELLLSYGFTEAPQKQRLWGVRHFFRPLQVNPLKLRPIQQLASRQGMLSAIDHLPVTIDSTAIPDDFVAGFERRRCTDLDCESCGYCGAVAGAAVRIEEPWRRETLDRYEDVDTALLEGGLWGVCPARH